MSTYDTVKERLASNPRRWTVTGAAGFIGSHIVEALLQLGQEVVGFDNYSTGHAQNVDDVRAAVGESASKRFEFIEGDMRDSESCRKACSGSQYLLHQAALGSVPRSIADPFHSASVNIGGFVNMLVAAHEAKIERVVFASSSSVYGDHAGLPKVEDQTGSPLSPYAATKCANEMFAGVFRRTHDLQCIGLRYFNVFGPRQDPSGAYAAVIPRWIAAIRGGEQCTVFGDGSTSRDFSYVADTVQSNILAATTENEAAIGEVFNIAAGERTTLLELYKMIYEGIVEIAGDSIQIGACPDPLRADFRTGDVKHSHADISKARRELGYEFTHSVSEGMVETLKWYMEPGRRT